MSKKKAKPPGSCTIETLLAILADGEIDTGSKIEAAQLLVEYECEADTAHTARQFLQAIFEDAQVHINNRLEALRISRKLEAAKIMPTTIHTNRAAGGLTRTEAWRNFEIWDLKKRIVMLTHDHPPKNYADVLLGPDYIPPGGFDGTDWPPTTVQRNGLIFNIVYGGKADTGD